jgi:hypothetical protein
MTTVVIKLHESATITMPGHLMNGQRSDVEVKVDLSRLTPAQRGRYVQDLYAWKNKGAKGFPPSPKK